MNVENDKGSAVEITGATENNLKSINFEVPFGQLLCLTGVSGSGKSTLVRNCLVPIASYRHQILSRSTRRFPLVYGPKVKTAKVPFMVDIRQGPITTSSRSIVGTTLGLLPRLREIIPEQAIVKSASDKILDLPTSSVIAAWCKAHFPESNVHVFSCLGRRVLGAVWPRIESALTTQSDLTVNIVETNNEPNLSDICQPKKFKRNQKVNRPPLLHISGDRFIGKMTVNGVKVEITQNHAVLIRRA